MIVFKLVYFGDKVMTIIVILQKKYAHFFEKTIKVHTFAGLLGIATEKPLRMEKYLQIHEPLGFEPEKHLGAP